MGADGTALHGEAFTRAAYAREDRRPVAAVSDMGGSHAGVGDHAGWWL